MLFCLFVPKSTARIVGHFFVLIGISFKMESDIIKM